MRFVILWSLFDWSFLLYSLYAGDVDSCFEVNNWSWSWWYHWLHPRDDFTGENLYSCNNYDMYFWSVHDVCRHMNVHIQILCLAYVFTALYPAGNLREMSRKLPYAVCLCDSRQLRLTSSCDLWLKKCVLVRLLGWMDGKLATKNIFL